MYYFILWNLRIHYLSRQKGLYSCEQVKDHERGGEYPGLSRCAQLTNHKDPCKSKREIETSVRRDKTTEAEIRLFKEGSD